MMKTVAFKKVRASHSLQANCFSWKLNSAREKLSDFFKQ